MGKESAIQWTDATWNIAVGCTKVDEDCKFCYMYRESLNGTRYNPLVARRTKTVFNLPTRIKEPSKIFVSSLTDWGLPEIDSYRDEMWEIIRNHDRHTYQMLTKRTERLGITLPSDWVDGYKNVWLGTSVGSQKSIHRVDELFQHRAQVYTISVEPMWGPVDLQLYKRKWPGHGLWVIIGGESGNDNGKYRYRECKMEWIESVIKQCRLNNAACFVKQLGTHLAKEMGLKDRHGGNIEEWPEHLRIRQFPIYGQH